ncbi:TetR family transcriptional regulator [Isoptericola aurantiacus]|uniref:TetR family transcriptional regulator n=1 Tax=Isoptericola aurantiacus TaxID=3377839 RepID=UPI00383AED39
MGEATTETKRADLRRAARDVVRSQVAESAVRLFDERGFDATTVDEVAQHVGISPRSFFRYFASKEDAVLGDPIPYGLEIAATLAARPADEDPWTALRGALERLVRDVDTELGLITMRVVMSAPTLRARHLEKHLAWGRMFEDILRDRAGGRLPAQVVVQGTFACLDVAFSEWVALDRAVPLSNLFDQAMAALR